MSQSNRGRPPKTYEEYGKPHLELIKILRCDGCTLREIYNQIGVSKDLAIRWREEHEEFGEAFKVGKQYLKNKVDASIYKRAVGYYVEDVQTEIKEYRDGTKSKYVRKNRRFIYSDKCATMAQVALSKGDQEYKDKWFPKDEDTAQETKLDKYFDILQEAVQNDNSSE